MRWRLILLGLAFLAALTVFLLNQDGTQQTDGDGRGASEHTADDALPHLVEPPSSTDAAGNQAEQTGRGPGAGPSGAGATASEAATEKDGASAAAGKHEGRAPGKEPTLARAARATEDGSRAPDDKLPAEEPTKGSVVQIRVVREGDVEPLPGALVILVDVCGQRHEQRADAKGVARFVDLPPGKGEADAVIEGWTSSWLLPLIVPPSGKLENYLRMKAAVPLHGFVRAASDGAAVSGARVVAVAGGSVHASRGRSSSSRGVYATVETDASGAFRFSALPKDEVCTLVVLRRGYRYAELGLIPRAGAKRPVEIRLKKGGVLLGRVTDPAGRAVAGAEVFAFLESQPHLALNPRQGRLGREPERVALPGVSGAYGFFEVVGLTLDATYAATAYAQGFLRAENVSGIVVTESAPEATIALGVGPAARVLVQLRDPEGRPVAGGLVVGHQRGRFTRKVTTGVDGTALIESIPAGQLRISVSREGFRPLKTTVKVGSDDALDLELEIEPLPPGVDVSGVAVDAGGKPIPGLALFGTSRGIRQTLRATTDSQGRFVLSGLQAGKVTVTLRASQRGFKPSSVQVEAPAEGVRLVVTRFTQVKGRVKLAPGMAKPAFVYVTAQRLEGDLGGGGTSVPFMDGTFTTSVTPDVEVRVQICADTFAPSTRKVRVPKGETLDLGTIPVESGVSVTGVVVDPEGHAAVGAVLEVALNFVVRRTATTDADGRFRLEHLPAGKLTVKLLAKGYAEQTQAVEATESLEAVRLVLTRGD